MDVSNAAETYSHELEGFVSQQRAAVDLQHSIGKLLLDHSIRRRCKARLSTKSTSP